YNYIELRDELKQLGYRFRGSSDTEVVLAAYHRWGKDCVGRFNGMWAFAIWDTKRGTLFCSRDRMGIKPFYYTQDSGRFIFASEIKSILAVLDTKGRGVNRGGLVRFICEGILNDSSETLFEGIEQLPGAHCMEIKQGRVRIWRYWDVSDAAIRRANRGRADESEAIERFGELLGDAVRLRFRADVAVGVTLSGGLDSSAILAKASQKIGGGIRSFTVEYEEKEFSEGHYARAAAKACGADAHFVTPSCDGYIDFIDGFTWHHDEPCAGSGMFSQWQVMRLASEHVKVVLQGQGADELLGGYHHYFNYYLTSVFKRLFSSGSDRSQPSRYLSDLHAIAGHTGQTRSEAYLTALAHLVNRIMPEAVRPLKRVINRLRRADAMRELVDEDFLAGSVRLNRGQKRRYRDDLNEILYRDLTRDNLPMLLQNDDRISMAFSVEARLPFLDYRLIEFAGELPYDFKIRGKTTKLILRKAMRESLGEKIVERPDKMGFPTPFGQWLKGPLRDYTHDVFGSRSLRDRGFFRPEKLEAILDQHWTGKKDHAWLIWRILNIETWMKLFFDDTANRLHKPPGPQNTLRS
ncbi:MAG: asparagine synthase (glutamine-hydrolyzing), partial [Planctomycetes bacterium]|nr:asparagine synthase (glutamine-hydrolyzing) [Planctomycetota bacterium]